jgi:MYXO-CTERM domain-containing protein
MPRVEVGAAVAGAAIVALAGPATAHAHFVLQAPASWAQQNSFGDPQKSAPCGQADPGAAAVPSNAVTAFQPGQTITVTINETITHPGHYRVALSSTGQSGLPADPPVTAGATPCGTTVIQSPPVFPVLADGMLVHTGAFSGPQSFQVTLPGDVTCPSCTLQVIQFMSDHGLNNPGGCFYHHCATISIQTGTGTGGSGGGGSGGATGGPADASTQPPGAGGDGCGCAVGRRSGSPILMGALLALLSLLARRKRA